MKYYLKTRDECREIVKKSDVFYCTETTVDGFKVELYDYRLASYTDFEENEAYELRGLTFVFNPETEIWERNIALNKFYNINQTLDWMYEDVKDKKIVSIADKRDGSLVSFVLLPNGKIVAKSKMSFKSEQAIAAQNIFDNSEKLREFVEHLLKHRKMPIFELTGPHNQIVLNYNNTELQLLQIRYPNGNYYTVEQLKFLEDTLSIKLTKQFSDEYNNLDKLLELKMVEINKEGYVGMFEDGQMFKIKTEWYLQLHGLISGVTRENQLIKTIIDGNIDDVVSELLPGEKRDFINNVTDIVNHRFNLMVKDFLNLREDYFNKYNENRKEFAIANSKKSLFSNVMRTLRPVDNLEKVAEEEVAKNILHNTKTLKEAKQWLDN